MGPVTRGGPAALAFLMTIAAPPALAQGAAPADPAPPKATSPNPESAPPQEPKPDTVTVGGTALARTGGSVHVIGQKQLERFEYDDPHAVLLSVPGVYVRGEDGFGLRPNIGIRGASSDRSKKITLMEDGVLFGPAPYSAPAAYYFPLITRMRSVRVVKGPGSVIYGPHTVGGAVDLITQEIPTSPRGTLDLGAGSFGYAKVHATYGASDEKVGFFAEGVHLGSTGFKTIDGQPGADTGYSRNEFMVKTRYVLDPQAKIQNEFTLKLGYSDEGSNETYVGLTDADFASAPYRRYSASQQDRMEWHRTQIALTHRATLSPDLDITTTFYRNDLDRLWRKVNGFRGEDLASVLADPTGARNAVYYGVLTGAVDASSVGETLLVGGNHRVFVSQGVQTKVGWRVRTGPVVHRVEYGLRLHNDQITRLHGEDGLRMRQGALVSDGRATALTADNRAFTNAMALHAMDAMSLGELTVSAGARLEVIRSGATDTLARTRGLANYGVFVPGVGAHYALIHGLGVLGGVHKGFSPAPPGIEGALPEASVNYEGGLRYSARGTRIEAVGFFNDYSNLTSVCSFSGGCSDQNLDRQLNVGAVWLYGVEAFAERELKLPRALVVPLRVSYTYTGSQFLTSFRSFEPQYGQVTEGDELPYVPKHQLSGTLGLESAGGRWGANVSGVYVGRMREQASSSPDAVMTDASFILDASAQLRITRYAKLYLNGRNLTDTVAIASRRPLGARPGAPRSFQVGLKLEF